METRTHSLTRVRRLLGIVAALALAAPLTVAGAPAAFAETAGWAQWGDLSGSAGNYSTTVQLPAGGFPAATMRSDSRGVASVISGASTWLSDDTPPGEIYGSSRNQRYINLRPRADGPTTPSTTTYTFERPTPVGGWAFVLGDIDADAVTVEARGADGAPLSADELGFQDVFNYCDADGSPSCTGGDLPSWNPIDTTLTGNDDAVDTSGASGWFQPTAPIKSLTLTFHHRQGFPVYQTWFASIARTISGIVTVPETGDTPMAGVEVTLFGPDGSELATTVTADDGTYSFPDYTASDGYEVEIAPPSGYVVDESAGEAGQRQRPADLGEADDLDVDFALREIVPVAVSGHVTDDSGNPIGGVEVVLSGPGGDLTVTTGSDGFYIFDRVDPGDYEFSVTPPDGYSPVTLPDPITVPADSEDPLEDNDFVLAELPTVSGTVTAGGDPVPDVPVTITLPDGSTRGTITDADGRYEFPGLEPGDHTVTIETPDGYENDGPSELEVPVADEDVTDVDFELTRPGSIGGIVTDQDGNPAPGATIEITGPDGETTTVTTGDDGSYFDDDLSPGDYTVVVIPPEGYEVDGEASQTVTITEAGESVLDVDFGLTPEEEEPPPGGDDGSEAGDEGGTENGAEGTDDGAENGEEGGADDGTDAGTDVGGSDNGTDDGTDGGGAAGGDDSGADGGQLPDTGTPLAPLVGTALLLLAMGVAVTRRAGAST